jgi:beta-lactamase regulating signal transducer with metallopeptidase domain
MIANVLPHALLPALPALAAWFTVGLLAVLALRHPLRTLAGPRSAYALWLLPPVAMLASLAANLWPLAPLRWPALTRSVIVLVHAGSGATAPVAALLPVGAGALLVGLWLLGSACALLVLLGRYTALRLALRVDPGDTLARHGIVGEHARLRIRRHAAGPALLWAPRPLLLLPPDFEQRFDAAQRRQILHHELCHRAQGDAWWNLLAALLGALFWWHPLRPWAQRAFALDQELACDARLFASRQRPALRSYADTLLQAASTLPLPLGSGVSHPRQLKERIAMLAQQNKATPRRTAVAAVLIWLLSCSAIASPILLHHQVTPSRLHPHGIQPTIQIALQFPPTDGRQVITNGHPMLRLRVMLALPPTDGRSVITNPASCKGPGYIRVYIAKNGFPVSMECISSANEASTNRSIDQMTQFHNEPGHIGGKSYTGWIEVPLKLNLASMNPATRS